MLLLLEREVSGFPGRKDSSDLVPVERLVEVFLVHILQVPIENVFYLHVGRGQESGLFFQLLLGRSVFGSQVIKLFFIVLLLFLLELFVQIERLCEAVTPDVYEVEHAFVPETLDPLLCGVVMDEGLPVVFGVFRGELSAECVLPHGYI